jgi:hypothetical protein
VVRADQIIIICNILKRYNQRRISEETDTTQPPPKPPRSHKPWTSEAQTDAIIYHDSMLERVNDTIEAWTATSRGQLQQQLLAVRAKLHPFKTT